jgi:hypothetical protein
VLPAFFPSNCQPTEKNKWPYDVFLLRFYSAATRTLLGSYSTPAAVLPAFWPAKLQENEARIGIVKKGKEFGRERATQMQSKEKKMCERNTTGKFGNSLV